MCGFHNSNLFYPVYISTVYTILLPKHFYTLYFAMFSNKYVIFNTCWGTFSCMGSTCSKGCMVSTTLYGIYDSTIILYPHSRVCPNAGTNQSEAISMFRILVSANLIHSIINELHTIRSVITDLVIIVRAEGKTTILILPWHNHINYWIEWLTFPLILSNGHSL